MYKKCGLVLLTMPMPILAGCVMESIASLIIGLTLSSTDFSFISNLLQE